MSEKALVTYGWCRNAWSVLRNLSLHGIDTYAGDSSPVFMAGSSKYCKGSFTYPSFYTRPSDFVQSVSKFIETHEIDTYIPIHEEILVVSKNRKLFPKNIKIPIDSFEKIYALYNKKLFSNLADELRITVPETFYPNSVTDIKDFASSASYPRIIKLQNSNGAKGVRIVRSEKDLLNNYRSLTDMSSGSLPIIQEYVEGIMYAVSVLYYEGRYIAGFVRRNLREKDYFGGTCTKCESVIRTDLIGHVRKILDHLEYTGVVMMEFKVNEDTGQVWAIEANPRYWGTTSHDIDCGIEFPYYQYCLANDIDFEPQTEYKEHIRSRWLIGDLIGLINTTKASKRKIKNIFSYINFNEEHYMDLKKDDIGAFIAESRYYLSKFLKYRSMNPIEEGMIN
jgi:predicted ATP-grasp superfamily ATP-dependent carboligase